MPHPGDIVRKGEFQGETSKLHPDFIQNLKILVPSLLDKPSLKMDPTGNLLTATQLVDYFKVRPNTLTFHCIIKMEPRCIVLVNWT